jgi:hypothetical protein
VENQNLFIEVCARLEYMERDIFLNMGGIIVCIGSAAYAFLQLLTMICNFSFYSLDTRLDYGCVHLTYAKARCKLKILK